MGFLLHSVSLQPRKGFNNAESRERGGTQLLKLKGELSREASKTKINQTH